MPLYAGKYAICTFLQNMRNMLRSHDRYEPVSLNRQVLADYFLMKKYVTPRFNHNMIHT